jgi:YHS domain-containing protein
MLNKRTIVAFATAIALTTGAAVVAAAAAGPDVNVTITGLALRGYDPVAYFTDGKPIPGDYRITARYNEATYRFASQEHKILFETDPVKYLPQYGGFCAFGAAKGVKVDGDPAVWKIVDDKLYLNLAPPVYDRWSEDIPGNVKSANDNWPSLKDKAPE